MDTNPLTNPTSIAAKAAVRHAVMVVAIADLAGVAQAEDAAEIVTVAAVVVARAGNADTR